MTQLNFINFKNVFVYEIGLIAIHEVSPPFDEEQQHGRPYQPKHSPVLGTWHVSFMYVYVPKSPHLFYPSFTCVTLSGPRLHLRVAIRPSNVLEGRSAP